MAKKETGQVILALILIMTVALAIGLSIVQKSLVDVSTSTKVEESSRAFSAAEAGIEHALRGGSTTSFPSLGDNNAKITSITGGDLIPAIPAANYQQAPLEYPPLAKEEVAHVWLANFDSTDNPPTQFYKQNSLDIYWGNSQTDKAALELTLVYYGTDSTDPVDPSTAKYRSRKWYLDQTSRSNNFTAGCGSTSASTLSNYTCKYTLTSLPAGLMLIRARLLYNTTSQPFAVQATSPCSLPGNGCFIPPQQRVFTSIGTSGETQRKVQVTQEPKVVPPYFDYAIFSVGDINK